jgi:hypothetical protein
MGKGKDVCVITFNHADFLPQIEKFGVNISPPKQLFQGE